MLTNLHMWSVMKFFLEGHSTLTVVQYQQIKHLTASSQSTPETKETKASITIFLTE